MAKRRNNTTLIGIGLVLLFFIVLTIPLINFNIPFSIGGGLSVLSVDRVSLTSLSEFFAGDKILVSATVSSLGQEITAQKTITSEEVNENIDGYAVTKGFTIFLDNQKQACEYDFNIDYGKKLYRLEYHEFNVGKLSTTSERQAKGEEICGLDNLIKTGNAELNGFDTIAYAVCKQPFDNGISDLTAPNIHNIVDVGVDVEGDRGTVRLDTVGASVTETYDNLFAVRYEGNLVSGQTCPNAQDNMYGIFKNGEWNLIKKSGYDNSVIEYTLATQDIGDGDDSNFVFNRIEDRVNQYNNFINSQTQFQFVEDGQIEDSTSIRKGQLTVDISGTPAQKPLLTFYINADKVGIFTPIPEVRIDSLTTSEDIFTGQNGEIVLKYTNTGTQDGSVEIKSSCEYPLAIASTQANLERYTKVGYQETVYIGVVGSTTEPVEKLCTVSISNVDGSSVDSRNVMVKLNPQSIVCPDRKGQTYCIGNQIYSCNEFGSEEVLVENCKSTEVCYDSQCIVREQSGVQEQLPQELSSECPPKTIAGIFEIPDYKCKVGKWYSRNSLFIGIIIGATILLFLYLALAYIKEFPRIK